MEVLGILLPSNLDSQGEPYTPSMLAPAITDGTRKGFPMAMEMEELVVTPSTTGGALYETPVTLRHVPNRPDIRQVDETSEPFE